MKTKEKILVLDVETANTTEDALVYDLGYVVTDRQGTIYAAESFVIYDVFDREKDLMDTAYYSQKLPQYYEGLRKNEWKRVTLATAKARVKSAVDEYHITKVCAYNARFDYNALNTTQRYITKSKFRFFLPYGLEIMDIWHMACQVICCQPTYIRWAIENEKVSPSGNILTNAEAVYSYITKADFYEEHTGLQDTLIETQILAKCYAQHKKMETGIKRNCWRLPQKKRKEMGI